MTTPLQPGSVIDGKYRLLRHIGEGGMGTVFEGENLRIKRKVAIKFLHAHVATMPEFAQRFVREARASARIGSDYVCDVLDLGDLENGEKYIVMELLDGESLEELLERSGRLTQQELAPIAFEVLDGLGAMHQVSVIHRDLKPANIFLQKRPGGTSTVKILDFGVAKVEATEEDPSGVVDMTTTGTMMGTPLYMSPEQARGARDVDGRTDLYSASVIFYRALTGDTPHTGTTLHELLFKIVLDVPKPIREIVPEVDEELADIIMRGLARDPENRYSSARQYQEAIAKWGESHGLNFKVTLPSNLPPLKKQTGGFPAAVIANAPLHLRTGDTPSGIDPRPTGPPTPVSAVADTHPARSRPPPAPSNMPPEPARAVSSVPTPTTPHGGDTLLAAGTSESKLPAARPIVAIEEVEETTDVKRKKLPTTAPGKTSRPPEPPKSNTMTYVIGAIVAIGAAIIGVKLGTAQPTQDPVTPPPPPSVSSVAPPTSVPTVVPTHSVAEPPPVIDAGTSTAPLPPTVKEPVAPVPPPSVKPPPSAKPSDMADAGGRIIHLNPNF